MTLRRRTLLHTASAAALAGFAGHSLAQPRTKLRVGYLQRRIRYAQDELEVLMDVQEMLPVQLRMHERQIRRWMREIRALRGDQMRRNAVSPTTLPA